MDDPSPELYARELSGFLARRLGVPAEELPRDGEWAGSGNTIGSLALRLGVLSMDQIEQIIDQQADTAELFGEIGIGLGFLDKARVERLLELQRLHRCLDLGGLLVMEGNLELSALLELLAAFFKNQCDQAAGPARSRGRG